MNDQNGHGPAPDTHMLFTFACGAIAGAAVALMFAPANGRETRSVLAQRSRRAKDKGLRILDEQRKQVSAAIDRGRDSAVQISERIGHAIEQGRAGYREAVQQGKNLGSDVMQDAEQALRAVRDGSTHTTESAN